MEYGHEKTAYPDYRFSYLRTHDDLEDEWLIF